MNLKRSSERSTMSDADIERLKNKHSAAWDKYKESAKISDENYQEFLKAERAYLSALYFERARRAVMADLFHSVGKTSQEVAA